MKTLVLTFSITLSKRDNSSYYYTFILHDCEQYALLCNLYNISDCVDPTPNHGTINSTNYEYGSVIKIQCEHGYILKGKSVIVCETMGIWSGTAECILYGR